MTPPRTLLRALFDAAVAAADPALVVPRFLPVPPAGRTIVVGAGKAAAAMARAFEEAWPHQLEGVVVTRVGHAVPCRRIRVLEASHPMPDAAGLDAARALQAAVSGLGPDDLVVALISGGGSALLPCPPEGTTLADEQAFTAALLQSGLDIAAMNLLRTHVSAIKGGRLALAAHPARVASLVLSDVPGDDPALVASGPTLAGRGTRAEALALLARTPTLRLPEPILRHLASSAADAPSPDDPRFAGHTARLIGSASLSLEAAVAEAARRGFQAIILSDAIEGDAREVARMHGAIARQVARHGRPFAPPVILLSGGETSVALSGISGQGGRNSTFALSLALELDGCRPAHALAADTDGIDGNSPAAGAFVDGGSVRRMRQAGVDPAAMLSRHDSFAAFERIDDGLITGPTRTNVNDFRAILIGGHD